MMRDEIIQVLRRLKFETVPYFKPAEPVPDSHFYSAVDEILSLMQPNSDDLPQLHKHDVSGRSEQLPLAEIQGMLIEAHNQLAKSGLSMDEYNPISSALVKAKLKLYELL